jgi:hypothetical protein
VKILNLNGRSVDPSADINQDDAESLAHIRDLHYRRLARRIKDEGSSLIEEPDRNEQAAREDELLDMIRATGDISTLLWMQNAQLRPSKDDIDGDFIFSNDSTSVKAHPCMCLDENNRQYDGRRVQLIIEPALLAAGDEDGKNYDQLKIRLPAIGWLSKEDPDRNNPNQSAAEEGAGPHNNLKHTVVSNDDVDGELERPPKRLKHTHVSGVLPEVDSPRQNYEERQEPTPSADSMEGVSKLASSYDGSEGKQVEATNSTLQSSESVSPNEDLPVEPSQNNAIPTPRDKEEPLIKQQPATASLSSSVTSDRQINTPEDTQNIEVATTDRDREVATLNRLKAARADESGKGGTHDDKVPDVTDGTLEVGYATFLVLSRYDR